MRVRAALVAIAALAVSTPAFALPGDGRPGGRGGRHGAPARHAAPRAAPREAPRAAPRAAPRVAPRAPSSDRFRGRHVPSGGQKAAPAATAPRFTSSRHRVPATTRNRTAGFRDAGAGASASPRSPRSPRTSAFRESRGAGAGSAPSTRSSGFRPAAPRLSPTPAPVTRDAYRAGWRNGYRVASSGVPCSPYHGWYDDHRWYLTFSFGTSCGPYYGVSYYRPFHSWVFGCDYAFFYPAPVSYCYVPFGFYTVSRPVYVTRYEVIRETVPVTVYEERVTVSEEEIEAKGPAAKPAEADDEVKVADPRPAAGSPATEKFLREASAHFAKKEYYEAAVKFRLGALSSPELPGPLFALGQSLMAMGQDAYAARVIRRAVEMEPRMLEETGDVAGVWETPAEFDRILKELEARAAAAPADGDARFLLAAERYFAGDVRCREGFDALRKAMPKDAAVGLFLGATEKRFKGPADLPPIEIK